MGIANSNTLTLTIEVDDKGTMKVRQFSGEVDKVAKQTQGLGGAANTAGNQVHQGLNTMRTSIGAVGTALAAVGPMLIGYFGAHALSSIATGTLAVAANFETMEIKLDQLTRGRGRETLEELNRWALEMPVNTQEAVNAFVRMKAYGLDPTLQTMETLTDVAVMMGSDAFERVSRALGQMQARGKLAAQELIQLSEVGINAGAYIKQAYGMTIEELQKTGVSVNDVIDTIWRGLAGEFGGASRRAQETWRGQVDILKSYVVEAQRLVANAGAFDAAKDALEGLNKRFAEWLKANEDLIKLKVPQYIGEIEGALKSLWHFYEALPEGIIGAAGYGILGRMVFGSWKAAALIAAIKAVHNAVKDEEGAARQLDERMQLASMGGGLDWAEQQRNRAAMAAVGIDAATIESWRQWQDKKNEEQMRGAGIPAGYRSQLGQGIIKKTVPPGYDDEEVKRLRKEILKAQEEFELAKMSPSRLEEFQLGGQDQNALARMEYERQQTIIAEQDKSWLTQAENDRANLAAKLAEYEKTYKSILDLTERTAEAMQENFSNLFFDAMTGKLKSLADYANAIFESIARMMSDLMAQQVTRGLFGSNLQGGGWLSQLFGGNAANLPINTPGAFAAAQPFHSGGIVTGAAGSRMIPAWVIATAPRLHNGLRPDEYAAVLQYGEEVKSRRQVADDRKNESDPKPKRMESPRLVLHQHFYSQNGRYDRESISSSLSAGYATLTRAARRNL